MPSRRDRLLAAARGNPSWREWLRQFEGGGVLRASDGADVGEKQDAQLTDTERDIVNSLAAARLASWTGSPEADGLYDAADAAIDADDSAKREAADAERKHSEWAVARMADEASNGPGQTVDSTGDFTATPDARELLARDNDPEGVSGEKFSQSWWEQYKADDAARRAAAGKMYPPGPLDRLAEFVSSQNELAKEINKSDAQKRAEAQAAAAAPPVGAVAQSSDGTFLGADGAPIGPDAIAALGPGSRGVAPREPIESPVQAGALAGFGVKVRAPGSGVGGMAPVASGLQAMADEAISRELQVAKAKADAISRVREENVAELRRISDERDARIRDFRERADRMERDIADSKIDPNGFWGSMSTGGQIMTAIAVMLGSHYGRGNNSNIALDALNRAIDRDIDAQKANLGKKQSLYATHLKRMGDEEDAYRQTKSDMLSIASGQIAATASRFGSQEAEASAAMSRVSIRQQIERHSNEMANGWAQRTAALMNARTNQMELQLKAAMAGSTRAPTVKVPVAVRNPMTGEKKIFYQDRTPIHDKADMKVRELMSGAGTFLANLARFQELADRNPHGGTPLGEDKWELDRLHKILKIGFTNLNQQGVIREFEDEMYDEIIPKAGNVGGFLTPSRKNLISRLRNDVESGLAETVSPYLREQ